MANLQRQTQAYASELFAMARFRAQRDAQWATYMANRDYFRLIQTEKRKQQDALELEEKRQTGAMEQRRVIEAGETGRQATTIAAGKEAIGLTGEEQRKTQAALQTQKQLADAAERKELREHYGGVLTGLGVPFTEPPETDTQAQLIVLAHREKLAGEDPATQKALLDEGKKALMENPEFEKYRWAIPMAGSLRELMAIDELVHPEVKTTTEDEQAAALLGGEEPPVVPAKPGTLRKATSGDLGDARRAFDHKPTYEEVEAWLRANKQATMEGTEWAATPSTK